VSEQIVMVCDSCGRNANGDSPDTVFCNPYGCGHDLCNEDLNLRTKQGGGEGCRVCGKPMPRDRYKFTVETKAPNAR
jgi:hypothetical protein